MQIADTIAPLGRVIDVLEWMISIGTYSEVTSDVVSRRRQEIVGFMVHYIVLLLQEDEAEDLTGLINGGDIKIEFAQELATEFNMPVSNITIGSIIAIAMTGVEDSKTYGLLGWVFGLLFFILFILLIVIFWRYRNVVKAESEKNTGDKTERHRRENKEQQGNREDEYPKPRGEDQQSRSVGKLDIEAGPSDNVQTTPPLARGTTIDLTNLEQTSKRVVFGSEGPVPNLAVTSQSLPLETARSMSHGVRRNSSQRSFMNRKSTNSNNSMKEEESRDALMPRLDSRGIQL